MKLGYGFGQDDIFKKPSNEMDKTPLKIAMNNQPGETISLGASPAFGQAQNNTKGSMNQPGLEVDVKQNELNAGADDPFTSIEQSGGITQSTVSSTQPGSPQGGSGVLPDHGADERDEEELGRVAPLLRPGQGEGK